MDICLLILLMVSTSPLVSVVNAYVPAKYTQQGETSLPAEVHRPGEASALVKRDVDKHLGSLTNALQVIETGLIAATPVAALVGATGVGFAATAVLGVALVTVSTLRNSLEDSTSDIVKIMERLQATKALIEKYQIEQKWDSWAPTLAKVEMDIEATWKLFLEMLRIKDNKERDAYEKEFLDVYSKYLTATMTLQMYITATNKEARPTFAENLGNVLATHVNCHEDDLIQYFLFIYELIYKGSIMDHFYYVAKFGKPKENIDETVDIMYDIVSTMRHIHVKCIDDSMTYVLKDVRALIDRDMLRENLAEKISSYLGKAFNRYNWMVVVYKTKSSDKTIRKLIYKFIKWLNNHSFRQFSFVTEGEVSVAVARQVRGTELKRDDVEQAIKQCVNDNDKCTEIPEKIHGCTRGKVELTKNVKLTVSQIYTAVHAKKRKEAHIQYTREPKNEGDDDVEVEVTDSKFPHIYRGICSGGHYQVMIKSKEEILKQNGCKEDQECGGRGKCIEMKDLYLTYCECNKPYYGERCEKDFKEEFKDNFPKDLHSSEGNKSDMPVGRKKTD